MAKAARKRSAGLAVITQDAADVLGTDLGRAVVANAATQILMRQAPQAIDQIADAFDLTDAERARTALRPARRSAPGRGAHRVRFEVVADADENDLAGHRNVAIRTGPSPAPRAGTAGDLDDADLF